MKYKRIWLALLSLSAALAAQAQSPPPQQQLVKVTGTVVNSAGKAVPNVEVATMWMTQVSNGKATLQPQEAVKTNAKGVFTYSLNPMYGKVMFTSYDNSRKLAGRTGYDPRAKSAAPVKIVLRPVGRVKMKVTADGPLEGNSITLFDRQSGAFMGAAYGAQEYDLALPEGSYRASMFTLITQPLEKEIQVQSGKVSDVGTLKVELTGLGKAIGKEALPVTFAEARGLPADFKLSDLKGKWVLMEFWGFW